MPNLNVAWWNLENLFDHENAQRPTAMKSKLGRELKGWTSAVRDKKIAQLASVIELMFDGKGPDLLGVCEAENEFVLQKLADTISISGRSYTVVSHDSPDARGIDVSFLVDENVLTATGTDHKVIVKRSPTRDIFWAEFSIKNGPSFTAIGNHWPARSAGQYKSEPFRMLTGETLAYVISEMLYGDAGDKHKPIIVMGDFNDEPFNRSMQEYLLGTRDPGRVRYSKSGHLLNLMWPLMQGHDPGTYLYQSEWNMLDHILVSYGMLKGDSPIKADKESISIFRPSIMKGTSGRPTKFGRPAKANSFNENGFSDHYALTLSLNY